MRGNRRPGPKSGTLNRGSAYGWGWPRIAWVECHDGLGDHDTALLPNIPVYQNLLSLGPVDLMPAGAGAQPMDHALRQIPAAGTVLSLLSSGCELSKTLRLHPGTRG